jgi:hypothetical protein
MYSKEQVCGNLNTTDRHLLFFIMQEAEKTNALLEKQNALLADLVAAIKPVNPAPSETEKREVAKPGVGRRKAGNKDGKRANSRTRRSGDTV